MPKQILVTGWRFWQDRDVIQTALYNAWVKLGSEPDTILIQGECPFGGADAIAKEIWEGWGFKVDPHPAEYDERGNLLGPKRNAEMVALRPDICLGFLHPKSRGTVNCIRLAREAGIETLVYDYVEPFHVKTPEERVVELEAEVTALKERIAELEVAQERRTGAIDIEAMRRLKEEHPEGYEVVCHVYGYDFVRGAGVEDPWGTP